jgi:hypothetical protein
VKAILASILFSLGLAVLALWALAAVMLGRVFFDFPLAWGLGCAWYFLWWGIGGYKMMVYLHGSGATANLQNPAVAAAAAYVVTLLTGAWFAFSNLPHSLSAWWLLLLPVTFVLHLAWQAAAEVLFNLVSPGTRRAG